MERPRKVRNDLLACLLLAMVTLAVFWQVQNCDFINLDDPAYVTANPHVQAGLSRESVFWAFTATDQSNWHPLTWLSHMVDYELYGLDPGGHHLTNVLFHLANTLLLFLLLKRMTGTLWRSGFVAALFALHPVHVESIAWVAERKDLLSTLFWMLTLWTYIRYVERPALNRYLLTLLLFGLGLMAKPMLVTLPFVLLLLDYWPLERLRLDKSGIAIKAESHASIGPEEKRSLFFRLVLEKTPFFVLTAASSLVTYLVQKSGGALEALEYYPIKIRIANGLVSYVKYLGKMFWPFDLAVLYPHPGVSLPVWQPLGAGALLICISVLVVRARRRYPYLLVGWLWFLGTLVPVIGLVQVGIQAMADRYTYIPLIGLFVMIAWGIPEFATEWPYRRTVITVAAGAVLSAMMILTWTQLRHWRNSITLFEHTVQVTSNNYLAHNNLGVAMFEQGKLDEAIHHYSESLRINPNYAYSHHNLGLTLERQNKLEEAISHYYKALQIRPDYFKAHYNLANALAQQGRTNEAIVHFSKAVSLEPNSAAVHNDLGDALARQGKFDQAVVHFLKAVSLEPNLAVAHSNLGKGLARQGRTDQAIVHFSKALSLEPNSAESHHHLGNVLLTQGKLDEAKAHYSKALDLRPDYPEAHNNLGVALFQLGSFEEALAHFSEAIRLNPYHVQAQKNKELVLQAMGKSE